jgi:N-acetylglucosaminyldiphosphoundecaprenol N-acetyl-beta-D-mannosaminyltransferase
MAGRGDDLSPTAEDAGRSRVQIGSVAVDATTMAATQSLILESVARRRRPPLRITTVNLDYLAVARKDQAFRKAILTSGLALADGMSLIWLSRAAGRRLPERISGADLTEWLIDGGLPEARLYLLGATPEVVDKVCARAVATGSVTIVGVQSPWGPEVETTASAIVDQINEAKADILLVAMGAPKQDLWLSRWESRLDVSVAAGIGASLDFLTGAQKRAPLKWQEAGFEWLYRLMRDPHRLWRRYLTRDAPYFFAEFARTLKRRVNGRGR